MDRFAEYRTRHTYSRHFRNYILTSHVSIIILVKNIKNANLSCSIRVVPIIEVTGLLKSVKSERKSEPQQKALREGANPIPPHTRACAERHPPSHARTAEKLSHTLETLKLTRVAWSDSANFRQSSKTGCSRVSRGDPPELAERRV